MPMSTEPIAARFRRKESRVLNCLPTACRNRTDAQKGEKNDPARGRTGPGHLAIVWKAPTDFSDRIETRAAAGPARHAPASDARDP